MIVFSFVLISRVSEHTFVCHFAYMCSTEPPTGLWSFLFHYLLLLLPVTFSLLQLKHSFSLLIPQPALVYYCVLHTLQFPFRYLLSQTQFDICAPFLNSLDLCFRLNIYRTHHSFLDFGYNREVQNVQYIFNSAVIFLYMAFFFLLIKWEIHRIPKMLSSFFFLNQYIIYPFL